MTICTATTRMTISPYDRDSPDITCTREVNTDGRHIGEHQGIHHRPEVPGDPDSPYPTQQRPIPAYDSLVTWEVGGAQSQRYDPEVANTNCVCVGATTRGEDVVVARLGHRPEDHRWATCVDCGIIHDTTKPADSRCSSCTFWSTAYHEYHAGPVTTGRHRGARRLRFHDDTLSPGAPRLYAWSPGSMGAFGGRRFIVHCDDGTTLGPADSLWDNGQIPWWMIDAFPPNARVTPHDQVTRPGHTNRFGQPLDYTAHPEV